MMKGIILAGGSGTRLYPLTISASKQLLPIYDKPMIYYPLVTLMDAGIRDVLIISTPAHIDLYKNLLGDGKNFGIKIDYIVQARPEGLAQAFILGEKFLNGDSCVLILGDNIFLSDHMCELLAQAKSNISESCATIFGYPVDKPGDFGIVEFDDSGNVISVEEKPKHPKSNFAIVGLYFYDSRVCEFAKLVKPSKRGELEITDINDMYLKAGNLKAMMLGEDDVWMDAGTFDGMFKVIDLVHDLSKTEPVSVPEIIAYRKGWIDRVILEARYEELRNSPYSKYLLDCLENNDV